MNNNNKQDWRERFENVLQKHNADDHLLMACECSDDAPSEKHDCAYGEIMRFVSQELTNARKEAVDEKKLEIIKMIEEEIWRSHKLDDEFLKKYQLTTHLIDDINVLCLKSHNLVLENLLNYLKD